MLNLKFLNSSGNFDDTENISILEKIPNQHSTYKIKKGNGKYLIFHYNNSIGEWDDCGENSPQYKNGQCLWEIFPIANGSSEYTIRNKFGGISQRYLIQSSGNTGRGWDKCGPEDDQLKNGQCKFRFYDSPCTIM